MKYLTIIFFFVSIAVVLSVYISPNYFWPVGFVCLLIPITLILNFILLLYFSVKKKSQLILPLIVLIFGFKFIKSTYSIKLTQAAPSAQNLTILNYNVGKFLNEDFYFDRLIPESQEMVDWIGRNNADIKCFQELYNNDKSKNWNTLNKLKASGKYNCFFSSEVINHSKGRFGIAILSRYPILNTGEFLFSDNFFNRAAFADIKFKEDTIRIINVHLESMEIKQATPSSDSSWDEIISNFISMYYRLKHGAIDRSKQTKILLDFIEKSPYKVLVCGDFNEMPYGYVYTAFSAKLRNAFEDAGEGFGFTYIGETLFFLRIDHQFYSNGLKAMDLKTFSNINFSDHHPLEGTYQIEEKQK